METIFITGSSSGIGEATARMALRNGHRVILHGKNGEKLNALSKELLSPHLCVDICDEARFKNLLQEHLERGTDDIIHAWIHCAGIYVRQSLLDSDNDPWQELFDVNTLGFLNVARAVVPLMKENHYGRIVHVISTRSLPYMANPHAAAYAASKAAALSLTVSLAKELAPEIIVNAVSPGYTVTDIAHRSWTAATWDRAKAVPLGRPAQPEEIASALLFLASSENSYIIGQNIVIDGGQTLSS